MLRDKFGRVFPSAGFKNGELEPYIIEEAGGGVTYICYTDDDNRAIRRITETEDNGVTTTTVEIAFGAWADRATLDYQCVNTDFETGEA
ncbi:MAG: hypothetical protein IKQ82_04500 [Lentisphaeria bacterium]|nr:hypothetical protein [Lentisphaeria bacterium]